MKLPINKNYSILPFLAGILFITNELRINYNYYNPVEIISFIFIVLVFCTLTYLFAILLFKDKIKSSLISVFFIIVNLFFSDILYIILRSDFYKLWFVKEVSTHILRFLFPTFVLLLLIFSTIIIKSRRNLYLLNLYFSFIFFVFIIIEITEIFINQTPTIKVKNPLILSQSSSNYIKFKPDIYYIILDSYTSTKSLKKYWDFDNYDFELFLKKNGFFVTTESKADYISTPYCISSYLNSSLLEFDIYKKPRDSSLNFLIYKNDVIEFLKNQGYYIVNYSPFDLKISSNHFNFLKINYLSRTSWEYISNYIIYLSSSPNYLSSTNLSIIHSLPKLKKDIKEKPIFVYAHIMMPHDPFIYDENGNKLSNRDKLLPDKIKYLKQLVFTNKLMIKTLNQLLYDKEAIIIIQGDHGFRYLNSENSIDNSIEAHSIFNSYHLPNGGDKILTDSTKPLNTFRIILNYYFGQKLELL